MAISLNQTPTVLGAWTGSMGSAAASGDTLFYVATAYSAAGSAISSSAPLYNGSSVTGATLLEHDQSSGTNSVYTGIWMLPNISGAHTSVAITMSGQDTPPDAHTVGLSVFDVAGLGASPAQDKGTASAGTSSAVTTGASGSITTTPEFVLGSLVIFGETLAPVGAPWTEPTQLSDDFCLTGYQIITSGSSSYTYNKTASGSAGWAGAIVTVKAASVTPASLLLACGIV
jgi:hypothetical protein